MKSSKYNKNLTKKPKNKTTSNKFKPLALAIALIFTGVEPTISQAATFTVINTNDTGVGSLRRAVFDANNTAGDDNIVFDASLERATINLTSGEIVIGSASSNDSLTITGPLTGQANGLIIDAGGNSRIFSALAVNNSSSVITLENMTLTGGKVINAPGGAINADDVSLTLNDSVVSGNSTTFSGSGSTAGGGIYSRPSINFNLNRSVISNNSSNANMGGGLFIFGGDITINDSQFLGNSTTSGSGIFASGGGANLNGTEVMVDSSIFSDNYVDSGFGAALEVSSSNGFLNQSTFSKNRGLNAVRVRISYAQNGNNFLMNQSTISDNQNQSGAPGVGLNFSASSYSNDVLTIKSSTITGNATGISAFNNYTPTLNLQNSILSGNTNNFDTGYTGGPYANYITLLNSQSSLFGDPTAEITGTNIGNYFSNSPDLSPLQSNGGGVIKNHLPNAYSPSVNTGNNALVTEPFDQRGSNFPRIQNVTVDMGSIERQPVAAASNNEVLKRSDMVNALVKTLTNNPPLSYATGLEYHDVQARDINANMIEKFKAELYTEGCAADRFCADSVVSREEMAKVFVRFFNGTSFVPSPSTNTFTDVPVGSFNEPWITELRDQSFTAGCNSNKFCPKEPVTREWFDYLLNEI